MSDDIKNIRRVLGPTLKYVDGRIDVVAFVFTTNAYFDTPTQKWTQQSSDKSSAAVLIHEDSGIVAGAGKI